MAYKRKRGFSNSPRKFRQTTLSRAAYGIGQYAGRSLYNRYRGTGSRTTSGSKSANPFPITGEHDARALYRRKRMPRGRRRRWVSFVRRTKAVIQKSLASSFFVALRQAILSSANSKQNAYDGHVALQSSTTKTNWNDIPRIHTRVQELATAQSPTGTNYFPDKFSITGYLVETQITNTGTSTAFIDLYYWRAKRNVAYPFNAVTSLGLNELMDWAMSTTQPNFPTGGSTLDRFDYGVTPFQNTVLAKYIQIYKKVRVKLSPGGVTQISQRSGRNHYFNWDYASGQTFIAGKTNGIYMIFYGAPNTTQFVAAPADLVFSTNVNYTYQVLQSAIATGGTTQA